LRFVQRKPLKTTFFSRYITASSYPPGSTPQTPDPEYKLLLPAEKCKAIMMARISGVFTSVGMSIEDLTNYGKPLYSIMPYILMPKWYAHPIIALRSDEKHYKNIEQFKKASLLVCCYTYKCYKYRFIH